MLPSPKIADWAFFLRRLRQFLDGRGFYEVMTDHVVAAGAFESTIDALQVSWRTGKGELHTSPEIEMKALIAEEKLPIYQICRCFRDDPESPVHRREFTMLEFYRLNVAYDGVIQDVKELLNALSGRSLPFQTMTVREVVERCTGIDLAATPDVTTLRDAILQRKLFDPSGTDDWNDLFFKILIERIEPALDPARPVVLTEYPLATSPLSAARADGWTADRFEIYWHGMELCNGSTELTDAAELGRRREKQNAERRAAGKSEHPAPERLLAALDRGLPPCAGVAIGLERLFAALRT